jgi:hypothetical protein
VKDPGELYWQAEYPPTRKHSRDEGVIVHVGISLKNVEKQSQRNTERNSYDIVIRVGPGG